MIPRRLAFVVAALAFAAGASAEEWLNSDEVRLRLESMRLRSALRMPRLLAEDSGPSGEQPARPPLAIARAEPPAIPAPVVEAGKVPAGRLGYDIADPAMRRRVLELYQRPDIVVERYVIGF